MSQYLDQLDQRESVDGSVYGYTGASSAPTVAPRAALRLLWLTFWLAAIAAVIGGSWDGYWHLSHPFDGFFSPPHIFVYGTCTAMGLVICLMTFTPSIRRAFGPGFSVPLIRFPVPGPLFILGGATVMLGAAGLIFDNFWHTNFGLDETNWSFPHAMIGWSLLLLLLGFISCRLALSWHKPLRWYVILPLATLVLMVSASPFMGPLTHNRTSDTVRALLTLPVFLAQAPSQHTLRIYEMWNLNRTNPLLIALAPLWLGAALAFVRRFDAHWWVVLSAALLWWLADDAHNTARWLEARQPGLSLENPVNWQASPILIPALLIVLLPLLRAGPRLTYLLAGLTFGLLIYRTYDAPSAAWLLAFVGAPLMLLGKSVGERAHAIVDRPVEPRAISALMAMGVIVPLTTCGVDLILRSITP
jgi:hypothetical protein